jgi:predicted aconitase with swiveling domain
MLQQKLGGHIFIMDGAGADGSATPQYAAYGETGCAAAPGCVVVTENDGMLLAGVVLVEQVQY